MFSLKLESWTAEVTARQALGRALGHAQPPPQPHGRSIRSPSGLFRDSRRPDGGHHLAKPFQVHSFLLHSFRWLLPSLLLLSSSEFFTSRQLIPLLVSNALNFLCSNAYMVSVPWPAQVSSTSLTGSGTSLARLYHDSTAKRQGGGSS